MNVCVIPDWSYWMVAGLVLATAGIVWIVTWTYMQDRYQDLLRQVAQERASNAAAVQDVKIREQIYGNIQMGDLDNEL